MTDTRVRVLILGGTSEAFDLADRLADDPNVVAISSLAGRVRAPRLPRGSVRIGGFGGVEGLVAYLRDTGIDLVVDATHPYATTISEHSALACQQCARPLIALVRPPWAPAGGDTWHHVADVSAAAHLAPTLGGRIFLAIGRSAIAPFVAIADRWFLVRAIDTPPNELPAHHTVILDRGPFVVEAEYALLRTYRIDVVVAKNSGGSGAYAKIEAARQLGLPVVMIARPPQPPVRSVATVEDTIAYIATLAPASRTLTRARRISLRRNTL
jgi:precorrin-6A/cobalt-precorrin-6A reductase